MTTICLVRHGETDWNARGVLQGKTDIPLNAKGRRQAEACGTYLKASEWDIIVTSPLQRAKLTAEIIQRELQIPLIEKQEFVERSYGDAEGLTPEERDMKFPDKVYPNQEDRSTLTDRVMLGVERIRGEYEGKNILLVAHGAVINTILKELSDGEIGSGKTKLLNTCTSNIAFENEKWEIINYNQVNHLSAK